MGSRLARRQVRWVLMAALLLGLVLSSIQIYWDYHARATKLESDLNLLVHSVQESAATAAYQLSVDLARAVCDGLVAHPNLYGCHLILDNDHRLVDTEQTPPALAVKSAGALFGGSRIREVALMYHAEVAVGTLRVDINPSAAINDFLMSALVVIGVGMVRAVMLAGVLFTVFYALVTSPVVRLSNRLSRIDPTQDVSVLDDWETRTHQDEIQDLERSAKRLVQQTGEHCIALDRAQAELKTINQSLEARVEERTQALETAMRKLEIQARTDPLTQLFNRRQFYREAERFLENWERYDEAFAILLSDLDRFKTINDRFGHDTGDQVLECLAGVLRDQCREGDLVARMGGEEFVTLIKIQHPRDAHRTAERIRAAIASQKLAVIPEHVTVSIGVAWVRPDESSLNDIVKRADAAMYRAKADGRNRVVGEDHSPTLPVK